MPGTFFHLPLHDLGVAVWSWRRLHPVTSLIASHASGGDVLLLVRPSVTARLQVFSSALERSCACFAQTVLQSEIVEGLFGENWKAAIDAAAILTNESLLAITNESSGHEISGKGGLSHAICEKRLAQTAV